ncbi:MAG: DMT family transporter [Acidimicrobiia bacterium]
MDSALVDNTEGLVFVALWASASIAAKKGFAHAAPLTFLDARFVLAAAVLLVWVHAVRRRPLPTREMWLQLLLLGLGNSTIYLGLSWTALEEVSAGLFSLCIGANPFIIALLSSRFLGRHIARKEWLGMALAAIGLAIATIPALEHATATLKGLLMVAGAMLAYSIAAVYRRKHPLTIGVDVINGWQIAVGAITVLPLAMLLNNGHETDVNTTVVFALLWSVVAVSIVANALMFRMQSRDPVRAGSWLLLTPVFGYLEAAVVLDEPIELTDVIGVVFVLAGLALAGTISLGALRRGPLVSPTR